jgi:hypothetical protein
MSWDAYSLVHVPRERELIYLNSENGRTLIRSVPLAHCCTPWLPQHSPSARLLTARLSLQSALAAAVSRLHSPSAASLDSWQFPPPPSANTALQSSSLLQLSPYHQNIERIGWYQSRISRPRPACSFSRDCAPAHACLVCPHCATTPGRCRRTNYVRTDSTSGRYGCAAHDVRVRVRTR